MSASSFSVIALTLTALAFFFTSAIAQQHHQHQQRVRNDDDDEDGGGGGGITISVTHPLPGDHFLTTSLKPDVAVSFRPAGRLSSAVLARLHDYELCVNFDSDGAAAALSPISCKGLASDSNLVSIGLQGFPEGRHTFKAYLRPARAAMDGAPPPEGLLTEADLESIAVRVPFRTGLSALYGARRRSSSNITIDNDDDDDDGGSGLEWVVSLHFSHVSLRLYTQPLNEIDPS